MTALALAVLLVGSLVLGTQSAPQKKRIVNGSDAGAFLYLVKIESLRPSESLIGSGSCITKNHVLTSASQIVNYTSFRLELRTISLSVLTGTAHPEYDPETLENDIGIIRASTMHNYVEGVIPLPDHNADVPSAHQTGHVRGFGAISTEPFVFPSITQPRQAIQRVLNTGTCRLLLGIRRGSIVTDSHFCINHENRSGVCIGDQGAGFISVFNRNDTLTGVVSIVTTMCHHSTPDIITRVSPFVEWIEAVIALYPPQP